MTWRQCGTAALPWSGAAPSLARSLPLAGGAGPAVGRRQTSHRRSAARSGTRGPPAPRAAVAGVATAVAFLARECCLRRSRHPRLRPRYRLRIGWLLPYPPRKQAEAPALLPVRRPRAKRKGLT
jgi:hypothetical protein